MKQTKFMCPNCYEIIAIKRKDDYQPTVNDLLTEFDFGEDPHLHDFEMTLSLSNIKYNCNCGERVELIELDEGMANIVSILNKKHYKTISSCEGHITNEENYSIGYLTFEAGREADDIFFINSFYKNFPSQAWIVNRTVFMNHSKVSIYMKKYWARDEERRKQALKFLEDFVNNLRDVTEG